jgi:amino acid adenylation domain-containing protein
MSQNTIQGMLSEAFERSSGMVAIEYHQAVIRYRDLNQKAQHIANLLAAGGVKKGSFVAILLENKIDLIAAIIGVLKAGGVFIPLDPLHPVKRLEAMLQLTDTRYLLIDRPNYDNLAHLYTGNGGTVEALTVDQSFYQRSNSGPSRREVEYHPEDPIYIYFTSGSSGQPKAVLGKNKSLAHFINWEIETLRIDHPFRVSQLTAASFDASLRDFFVPLCSGGTVCIPENREFILDAARLIPWIDRSGIELIHCTPSLFRLFNSPTLTGENFAGLKYVLMAGERIYPQELRHWFNTFGERIQLVNLYGPTETTMVKTFYFIKESDTKKPSISVGKPMKGARIIILDENLNPCGEGAVGEIYIRTPYRTLGYYSDHELTQKKFIVNPFHDDPDDLIYKTEDLGRLLPDGNLEFLGRIDRQVKIRGNRVELAEIETKLLQHELVKEAVILDRDDPAGNKYLCAYLRSDQEVKVEELRGFLAKELPDYMLPSFFIQLEKIPLTPNGKVDWRSLPEPDHTNIISEKYFPPRNRLEEELVKIWQEVLGVGQIGIYDSFFHLGGDSLKIVQVIARLKDIKLEIKDVLLHPTIAEISEVIEHYQAGAGGAQPEAAPPVKPEFDLERIAAYQNGHKPNLMILDEVIPFNDVLYKNCFFNAFFPVVRFFNRDARSFLADDLVVYVYDQNENDQLILHPAYLTNTGFDKIIEELVLTMRTQVVSGNIASDIIEALSNRRLVVTRVDCFHEPIRADMYQMNHWPHVLLIYGYDQTEKVFHVIEHENLNSLSYKKNILRYRDFVNSYYGYIENFQKGEAVLTYFEFGESGADRGTRDWSDGPDEYLTRFTGHFSAHQEHIFHGIEQLKVFKDHYGQVVASEAALSGLTDPLILVFNNIIKAKIAERYQVSRLFGADTVFGELLEKILKNWNYLQVVLEKYKYSMIYREDYLRTSIERLQQIIELELEYGSRRLSRAAELLENRGLDHKTADHKLMKADYFTNNF